MGEYEKKSLEYLQQLFDMARACREMGDEKGYDFCMMGYAHCAEMFMKVTGMMVNYAGEKVYVY